MIEIKLTRGKIGLVDDIDADLLAFKWQACCNNGYWYARRGVYTNGKIHQVSMHRTILERMVNRPLTRKDHVDHIHGLTLDNRRSEIRLATPSQNQCNQPLDRNNTSGYKGVSFDKRRNRFYAVIYVNRKQIRLGGYATAEDAYAAYCEAALKYHGEFANFGSFDLGEVA